MAKSNLTQADAEMEGLIDGYWGWLREQTSLREFDDWTEITTPYLDRHNDQLQVYVRPESNGWLLTDDGYVIHDLVQAGCGVESSRGRDIVRSLLAGFGVNLEGSALVVMASSQDFPLRKHSLLQAMLSVGCLFRAMAKEEIDGCAKQV